ncbi:hypothetical protein [Streptomyces soliscabiei]|uniref:hypothetical protein n=1 Tax=Streptomyces soliscabiei TaxID=588897 RepID=UPI0029B92E18|nr:hypothetical protein [Streptomyces sp. NY05-11A]MDX2683683.1 hypothetical protein [Streptomyces sp. NY05-11A]
MPTPSTTTLARPPRRRAPRPCREQKAGALAPRETAARPGPGGRGRCPRCGAVVLVTPGGELLELEPHPLAITRPDGSRLTLREAAAQATGRTPPIGHHVHVNGPRAPGRVAAPGYGCHAEATQLALFGAA